MARSRRSVVNVSVIAVRVSTNFLRRRHTPTNLAVRLDDLSSMAKPTEIRVLPRELQLGDRVRDATGEWEVSRPYASAGGKLVSAHVRKVGRPEATDLRTWGAHERISVTRA